MKQLRSTFSIRQMVELTGLSEFTIRGWENRYSAFQPRRGDTGRRHYSKADIERALLMRELILRGKKIGAIAQLSNQRLLDLFKQVNISDTKVQSEKLSPQISEMVELLSLQKWDELEYSIQGASYGDAKTMVNEFFLPLLKSLATKADQGLISIAQEHTLSSLLKERIYRALFEFQNKTPNQIHQNKTKFVLAAPEGDYHETGLLLAHLLLRSKGIKSLYLGAHTPARDLAETCLRLEAQYALVVSTVSRSGGARQDLLKYVSEVRKKTGSHLHILVAGSQTPLGQNPRSNLTILHSFDSLNAFLEELVRANE